MSSAQCRSCILLRDPWNPTSGTSKPDLCLTEPRDNLQEPHQASHQVATDKLPPLRIKPALVLTRSTWHLGHETGALWCPLCPALGPLPWAPTPAGTSTWGAFQRTCKSKLPVAGPRLRTASCRLASTRPERSLVRCWKPHSLRGGPGAPRCPSPSPPPAFHSLPFLCSAGPLPGLPQDPTLITGLWGTEDPVLCPCPQTQRTGLACVCALKADGSTSTRPLSPPQSLGVTCWEALSLGQQLRPWV